MEACILVDDTWFWGCLELCVECSSLCFIGIPCLGVKVLDEIVLERMVVSKGRLFWRRSAGTLLGRHFRLQCFSMIFGNELLPIFGTWWLE